jgi:hypothetical protein
LNQDPGSQFGGSLTTTNRPRCARTIRTCRSLAASDPVGEVAAVWLAREFLVDVYAVRNLDRARHRLIVFFQHAAEAEIRDSPGSLTPSTPGPTRFTPSFVIAVRATQLPAKYAD